MPYFSKSSKNKLSMAHWILQEIANRTIRSYDIIILTTHRNKSGQDKAFETGASKVKFPNSGHNKLPSKAMDAMPYPVVWADKVKDPKEKEKAQSRVMFMAGMFFGIFEQLQNEAKEKLALYKEGRLSLEQKEYERLNELLKYRLRWGHDWDGDKDFFDNNLYDGPHFELELK